jgi:hypothetical protein
MPLWNIRFNNITRCLNFQNSLCQKRSNQGWLENFANIAVYLIIRLIFLLFLWPVIATQQKLYRNLYRQNDDFQLRQPLNSSHSGHCGM